MTTAQAAESPEVKELIDSQVAEANKSLARGQQVRKFAILPRDFTVEDGELTPTMKMKRSVIEADYGAIIGKVYE